MRLYTPVRLEFVVQDLPPKKDGAQSMWGKSLEADRLIALRQAALAAFSKETPLNKSIKLKIEIHVGAVNHKSTGDLDNFITGICDGLMAAVARSTINEKWSNPSLKDIHPHKKLIIEDDCEVISIEARKIIGGSEDPCYRVVIEGFCH